jgi:hypothetical protein
LLENLKTDEMEMIGQIKLQKKCLRRFQKKQQLVIKIFWKIKNREISEILGTSIWWVEAWRMYFQSEEYMITN